MAQGEGAIQPRRILLEAGVKAICRSRNEAYRFVDRACNDLGEQWEKPYLLTLEMKKSTRSTQQNRYLNGIAYKLIGDATGYERNDISEYLCGTFWGWREKKVPKKPGCNGTEKVPVRTTTTNEDGIYDVLSWSDFSDFIAFVQRFGAEHGIYIPDPDPELRNT